MLHDPADAGGPIPSFGIRFLEACRSHRSRAAIRSAQEDLSYERVFRAVVNYALQLRRHGIGRQSMVLVHVKAEHGMVILVLRMALALVGASWSSYNRHKLGARPWTHVISTDEAAKLSFKPLILVDGSWNALSLDEINRMSPTFGGYQPGDVVYFAQTSGTTGQPRLVVRTLADVEKQIQAHRLPVQTMSSLFPYGAERNFWRTVGMLMGGGTIIENPALDVDARRPGIMVGSKAQVEKWLSAQGNPPSVHQRLPWLYPMGALVSAQDVGRYLGFFEKVTVPYAGTEMGRVGTANLTAEPGEPYVNYVIEKDVVVQIVDDGKQPLPPGAEGQIRVETPRVQKLRAMGDRVAVSADGWFYPGDRGVITGDGRLMVTGRVGDVLNILGVKADANLMDAALKAMNGVADAVVFELTDPGMPSRLSALVVKAEGTSEAELAASIRKRFNSIRHFPTLDFVYFVPSLPVNDNGKVVRRFCQAVAKGLQPS